MAELSTARKKRPSPAIQGTSKERLFFNLYAAYMRYNLRFGWSFIGLYYRQRTVCRLFVVQQLGINDMGNGIMQILFWNCPSYIGKLQVNFGDPKGSVIIISRPIRTLVPSLATFGVELKISHSATHHWAGIFLSVRRFISPGLARPSADHLSWLSRLTVNVTAHFTQFDLSWINIGGFHQSVGSIVSGSSFDQHHLFF